MLQFLRVLQNVHLGKTNIDERIIRTRQEDRINSHETEIGYYAGQNFNDSK